MNKIFDNSSDNVIKAKRKKSKKLSHLSKNRQNCMCKRNLTALSYLLHRLWENMERAGVTAPYRISPDPPGPLSSSSHAAGFQRCLGHRTIMTRRVVLNLILVILPLLWCRFWIVILLEDLHPVSVYGSCNGSFI